uniref:Uncharacterized protein n=1 Tax=Heliothis virescens TaxID=7102 RepID=A0A2A4K728_HELVI
MRLFSTYYRIFEEVIPRAANYPGIVQRRARFPDSRSRILLRRIDYRLARESSRSTANDPYDLGCWWLATEPRASTAVYSLTDKLSLCSQTHDAAANASAPIGLHARYTVRRRPPQVRLLQDRRDLPRLLTRAPTGRHNHGAGLRRPLPMALIRRPTRTAGVLSSQPAPLWPNQRLRRQSAETELLLSFTFLHAVNLLIPLRRL